MEGCDSLAEQARMFFSGIPTFLRTCGQEGLERRDVNKARMGRGRKEGGVFVQMER